MTLLDRTEDPAPDLITSERIITGLAAIFGVLTHLGLMRVLPGGEAWMILLSLTAASLMFLISGEVMSRSALAWRRHRLMVHEDEGAA